MRIVPRRLLPGLALVLVGAPAHAQQSSPIAFLEQVPVAPPAATLRTGEHPSLVATLRVPEGPGPFPVVVLVHGGCWLSRFADDAHLAPLAEALRADGLATWSVRYRRVDEGGRWPVGHQDVAAAADSLRAMARRFPLDTTRVVALGHSAGALYAGFLAARPLMGGDVVAAVAAGRAPLRVGGVVAIDGPLALAAARPIARPVCGREVLEELVGGTPDSVPARWRAASAAGWLARPAPGVRQGVVVGGLDARVVQRLAPAASLREHARASGAAVFLADTAHHFTMLDPASPAFLATRDAVRHVLGLAPEGRAGADRAAMRSAYRAFVDGIRARRPEAALAFLTPDFEHHTRRADGGVRVGTRDEFAGMLRGAVAAIDSVLEFTIDVRDVELRGDSAVVRYRERMDLRLRPPRPGVAAPRDSSTSWWADRWVRTPAGWRVARFVEVPPPR